MTKTLLAFLSLLLFCSCASGKELVEVYAHADGALTAASDLNHYVIVADGAGEAQIRPATVPLPLYLHQWDKAQVIVGQHNPEVKMAFPRGTPLPDEARVIVLALLTFPEIQAAGLTFVTPLPPP